MPTSEPCRLSHQHVQCVNITKRKTNDNIENDEITSKRVCVRSSESEALTNIDEAMEFEENHNIPMTLENSLIHNCYSNLSQTISNTSAPHKITSQNKSNFSSLEQTVASSEQVFEKPLTNMEDECGSQYTLCNPNYKDSSGVGDNSPTTGRVRCYCKPSWDGLDLLPYISDIY